MEVKKNLVAPKKTTGLSSDLVVQHNYLVQASYSLTLQEKRIILWLSSQVNIYDTDFKDHTIQIKDFCAIAGLRSGNIYKEIKQTTKSLMTKMLEVRSLEDGSLEQISWLSYAKYLQREGQVVLRFDPALKKYLLELSSCFTKIRLSQTLLLKSVYSLRLYEFVSQFLVIGYVIISIDEIKYRLQLQGNKYSEYNNFKRRVIESSCLEISEKSDLQVDFEEIKKGKKVISIKFLVSKKKGRIKYITEDSSIIKDMMALKVTRSAAETILKEYPEETVRQGLLVLENYQGSVKNPALFLKKAIQEAWQPFMTDDSGAENRPILNITGEIQELDEDDDCKNIRLHFLASEGEAFYLSWIKELKFFIKNRQLLVIAPNKFMSDWVDINYKKKFIDYSQGVVDSVSIADAKRA